MRFDSYQTQGFRDEMRRRIGNFIEVYVYAPLEVCEQRDVKGIYLRARARKLQHVTGLDDPYEPPLAPEIVCPTYRETPEDSAARVLAAVDAWQEANIGSGETVAPAMRPLRQPRI